MKFSVARLLYPFLTLLFLTACSEADQTDNSAELENSVPSVVETEAQLIARAQGIHDRVITLDTHADISTTNFTASKNYTMDLDTQVTLPKMEAGGLDVAWFIVYTGQRELDDEGYAAAYANAIDKFEAIHRLAEEISPDRIEIAYNSDDVRRISAAGKKVAMIGIENAYPVGLDMSNIEDFHRRGARYMSLAHNGHSQFSDSHSGETDNDYLHGGLSEMGRQAVAEMNRLGIMVDISHPSIDAISQMLDITRAPLIASHSSARVLTNHTRNLSDELLLRIKENGGVVQTVAFATYVNEEWRIASSEGRAVIMERLASEMGLEILEEEQISALDDSERESYQDSLRTLFPLARAELNASFTTATVSDFADHIDHIVNLIGIEHVGISSDFDGGGGVEGWDSAAETFNVTLELVRRGYSEEKIAMLWSGNLLRVLDDVQRIAAEIQSEA